MKTIAACLTILIAAYSLLVSAHRLTARLLFTPTDVALPELGGRTASCDNCRLCFESACFEVMKWQRALYGAKPTAIDMMIVSNTLAIPLLGTWTRVEIAGTALPPPTTSGTCAEQDGVFVRSVHCAGLMPRSCRATLEVTPGLKASIDYSAYIADDCERAKSAWREVTRDLRAEARPPRP